MGRFRGSIALKTALLSLSFSLLLDGNAWASGCSKAELQPYIESLNSTDSLALARSFKHIFDCDANAVPALVEALKDDRVNVRLNAAWALGNLDADAKPAVPALIKALKDSEGRVRANAAYALGNVGADPEAVVPLLIGIFKDKDEDSNVRFSAAASLGNIGADAKVAIPTLVQALKDDEGIVSYTTAEELGKISFSLQAKKERLSSSDLEQSIKDIESALKVLKQDSANVFTEAQIQGVRAPLVELKEELNLRKLHSLTAMFSRGWLVHTVFWLALIFAYPRSPQVQAIFFWNPWVRRITGLGYVGFALTWVPFLRMKLFEPFRESLLADAALENFNPQAYFADSEVKQLPSGQVQPIRSALPSVKGQIVLEGSSGLGKTMFLRQLVQRSQRVVVYLPAEKCTKGVIEAIQAKLHGEVIKDQVFLQNLIYSGAIDVCIDGLNEVSADTRAKIVEFTENYFKGNIILATQPMEWQPPSTAKCWVMQPLRTEQIREFLVSRQPLIPAEAPVRGAAYVAAGDRYLAQTLSGESIEELAAAQHILSNPMDLTVVASMLAVGKQPNLFRLQEQQYQVMAAEYEAKHLQQKFPLAAFSEAVYQLRLKDEAALPETEFLDAILCMERHKMVVSRQSIDSEGKPIKDWYFRHDKILEFFIMQTFMGTENDRPAEHLGDPRFRGVYFLLARLLPIDEAIALREQLIQYAADTKDHTVSDTFVQLLRSRSVPHPEGKQSTSAAIA